MRNCVDLKVVFLSDKASSKIKTCTYNKIFLVPKDKMTIGSYFSSLEVSIGNHTINYGAWDTVTWMQYDSQTRVYCRNAKIAVIFGNHQSLSGVDFQLRRFKEECGENNTQIVFVFGYANYNEKKKLQHHESNFQASLEKKFGKSSNFTYVKILLEYDSDGDIRIKNEDIKKVMRGIKQATLKLMGLPEELLMGQVTLPRAKKKNLWGPFPFIRRFFSDSSSSSPPSLNSRNAKKNLAEHKVENKSKYDFLHKMFIVGLGWGKTALLYRFLDNAYYDNLMITWGVQYFGQKTVVVENRKIKNQIWDSNEQFFRFIDDIGDQIRRSNTVFICFDITSIDGFKALREVICRCVDSSEEDVQYILVGTRADLVDKRQVSQVEAAELAVEFQLPYFECSAKTGKGVHELFDYASRLFLRRQGIQARLPNYKSLIYTPHKHCRRSNPVIDRLSKRERWRILEKIDSKQKRTSANEGADEEKKIAEAQEAMTWQSFKESAAFKNFLKSPNDKKTVNMILSFLKDGNTPIKIEILQCLAQHLSTIHAANADLAYQVIAAVRGCELNGSNDIRKLIGEIAVASMKLRSEYKEPPRVSALTTIGLFPLNNALAAALEQGVLPQPSKTTLNS